MSWASIKILGIIHDDPFDPRTWSGISQYFFRALKEKGCLYQAISAEPSGLISSLYKGLSFHPDIAAWRFRYHLNTGFYKQMTKAALRKLEKFDVHGYNVVLQVGAWFDAARKNGKMTVSYHDGNLRTLLNGLHDYPSVSAKYIQRALRYEKDLYQKIDIIFPMSAWLADSFMRDFGVKASKLHPVGAGINLPYVKEVNGKSYDEPNLLFIGNDFERKGGRTLLDAFKIVRSEIRNATLTIIGPVLNGLPEGVRALGPISKHAPGGLERLLNEYASASVFVMPSLYEPFGIVFAEAMAHKLPCIGTDICAMPEIIQHGFNGYLVPPKNSELLAEKMMDLLKDPDMCRQMGENGYSKYARHYTWDRVTEAMVQCIAAKM